MSLPLILLIAGAVVLLVVMLVGAEVLDKRTVADRQKVWREVAERRGGMYRPGVYGNGGWRTPQMIEVGVNGARIHVDTYRLGESENMKAFTRARVEYLTGGGPAFEISVPTLVVTGPRVALGDHAAFDAGFVILTNAPAVLAAVWPHRARDRMLRLFRGEKARVQSDGRLVTMTWEGDERFAEKLDAAIDIMSDLALAGRGVQGGG